MRDELRHLEMENVLHSIFKALVRVNGVISDATQKGILPERMGKNLVNSVVEAMEEAQREACKDCPAAEGCGTKDKVPDYFKKLRFGAPDNSEEPKKKLVIVKNLDRFKI